MDWKKEAEYLKFKQNKSWTETADILERYFPLLDKQQVLEKVRGYIRGTKQYKSKQSKTGTIGVFSDIHLPFAHKDYLQFLKETFKQYKVNQIICCGDLVDNHALSRHPTEPCAKGAYDELDLAKEQLKGYIKAFPKVTLILGNHDKIVHRQGASIGIGSRYMKSFSEVLELPNTWEIEEEIIIDNVLYKHGENCTGKDGALNTAINERISTVIGHSHSFGGCKYSANKRDSIFGLNVGCGIDVETYAFIYGKHFKYKPTLGCGIVFNSGYAIFVPMQENKS